MKKKFFAFLLSAAMVLSLTACGQQPAETAEGEVHFEVIVKSFQSTYWQAAVKGIEQACEELGVTATANGPSVESDIADQVQMLKDAIEKEPAGIAIAACDKESVVAVLELAKEKGIPVICFDTGVPNAPDGSVYATVATDNLAAGALAAEKMYPAIKDQIMAATTDAKVRIGEVNQDATAQNIQERGLGFINKMIELITADGKTVAVVGNEFYVNNCSAKGDQSSAEVIIEVGVPTQTTVADSKTVAEAIMAKKDTIAVFGSNQVTAEGIIGANDTTGLRLGNGITAVGFDAGKPQKQAVASGLFLGSITQSPLLQGYECIKTLYAITQGEEVEDLPMDGYWYDKDNMNDESIAPNLYD